MFDNYEEQIEDDEVEVCNKKTNQYPDSFENQKSSRRNGNTRRDKERQKKQSRDRDDLYEDRWN